MPKYKPASKINIFFFSFDFATLWTFGLKRRIHLDLMCCSLQAKVIRITSRY